MSGNEQSSLSIEQEEAHEELEKCLRQFKKGDIISLAATYHPTFKQQLEQYNNLTKLTKVELIDNIITSVTENGYDMNDVAITLNLTSFANGLKKITWHTYEILNIRKHGVIKNIDAFQNSMADIVSQNNFRCELKYKFLKEGIWSILLISPITLPNRVIKKSQVNICYFPGTPFVFLSGIGYKKYSPIILQALTLILDGTKDHDMALSGKCVYALYQLALQKGNQMFKDTSHLPEIIQQKFKKSALQKSSHYHNDLNKEDSIKRRKYTRKSFGDNQQPELQVTRIVAITRFKGFEQDEDKDLIEEPASAMIKFAGKNVLEGLRDMLDDKTFSVPLPNFIETLPVSGINDFTIRERLQ